MGSRLHLQFQSWSQVQQNWLTGQWQTLSQAQAVTLLPVLVITFPQVLPLGGLNPQLGHICEKTVLWVNGVNTLDVCSVQSQ